MDAGSYLDDSFHIESHVALLPQPVPAGTAGRTLDAIVVPTIKPRSLQTATVLATELGCALVVLCSTEDQAQLTRSKYGRPGDDMFVTYVPRSFAHKLPWNLTFGHPEKDVARSCHVDIARKRNVGLLLARLCGWRTVMYLDDDIRGVTADAVSRAADLTACFKAVGFEVSDYPDNSVVCHAHRLTGGDQDVFPGGSALVIDAAQCDTLFPPVYNEDWFFLFDAVQDRSVTVAGALGQREYQPFARSSRAAAEEFGDLIAEGLYRLVHQGADLAAATQEYWRGALERRFQLIDDIAARLVLLDDGPLIGPALVSLTAARKRLATISALACVSFIRAWRTDLAAWRQVLADLDMVGDLADAMKILKLSILPPPPGPSSTSPALDRCVNQ